MGGHSLGCSHPSKLLPPSDTAGLSGRDDHLLGRGCCAGRAYMVLEHPVLGERLGTGALKGHVLQQGRVGCGQEAAISDSSPVPAIEGPGPG